VALVIQVNIAGADVDGLSTELQKHSSVIETDESDF